LAIAKRLTQLGYKSRQGKNFRAKQVKRMVREYESVYSHNGNKKAKQIKGFTVGISNMLLQSAPTIYLPQKIGKKGKLTRNKFLKGLCPIISVKRLLLDKRATVPPR